MKTAPITNTLLSAACLLAATSLGVDAVAAPAKTKAPEAPLTDAGNKLMAKYSGMLDSLRAEITKALPQLDPQQQAEFLQAYQAEAAATAAELAAMRSQAGKGAKDPEAAAAAYTAVKEALAQAVAKAQAPAAAVRKQLAGLLASDKLDPQLVKCAVLTGTTPRGLAAFAQQGKEQEALVDKLLADDELMKQMLVADGARDGNYGRAMEIYTEIRKASAKSGEGILQRLALGTSLEHAVPVAQTNAAAETSAATVVDPVERYLHFEKAYLDGELDPAFKNLSAWECRFVTNGDEPDRVLAWGREMLRNYRPDHIHTPDTRWRYVNAVKTDVKYGSQEQKNDLPSLHSYQNIINTGGVCGRRAFFGRFILRCFGIPTIVRPQKGHATLVHWTPDGWVICLGAGWGWGWTTFGQDVDFLADTQGRKVEKSYPQVLRARWIGDTLGEARAYGFNAEASGFWNGVALYQQRAIIAESKAVALAAVGTDIGEANESKEKEVVAKVEVSAADKEVTVGPDQVITIPAAACTSPASSTAKIVIMKSFLGGLQLHYNRNGAAESFEYAIDAPAAGKYALTARVVTVSPEQHLLVAVNDAKEPVDIALPYTIGRWQPTEPVEVTLTEGRNTLRFTRNDPVRGLTIKDFTLKPAK